MSFSQNKKQLPALLASPVANDHCSSIRMPVNWACWIKFQAEQRQVSEATIYREAVKLYMQLQGQPA